MIMPWLLLDKHQICYTSNGEKWLDEESMKLYSRRRWITVKHVGRDAWSSGYGRWLTFWRSWVRIPVLHTGWAFFTLICCKIVFMFVWKRPKINEKEAGDWPIFRGKNQSNMYGMLPHMCCLIFGSLTKTQQLTTWANTAFISFN